MLLQHELALESDDHLDMTPMVDVVFQLMTFLLLTYHAAGGGLVHVPTARHGVGVEESGAVILTLMPPAGPGAPAQVFAGTEPEPTARLDSPEAITKFVADGVADGRRKVILQADGAVPHGEVLRIAATAADVEGVLLHIGVQEPE